MDTRPPAADTRLRDKAPPPGSTSQSPAPSRADAARLEAALFPALGDDAMNALAAHFGMTRAELDRWADAFRRGGRGGAGPIR